MKEISLAYGQQKFNFTYDPEKFSVIDVDATLETPLSDIEIDDAFDSPIASPPLDEIAGSDDEVLIVVSDATRATASAQIVNLLVRRLVQCGVSPANIAIIFATGIHRPVSEKEKLELLSPFIVQRIKTINHDAYDRASLLTVGQTERGIVAEVNKALVEYSKIILTGGINFHYFAGFTGGRKSICPGLASAATIEATHMFALDFEKGGRRNGVANGLLEGNVVHEECERIAGLVGPAFGINAIVDDHKQAVGIFCGDWRLAHRAACEAFLKGHSVEIKEQRDLVVVSCGGFPHDINMIQSHKAMDMAAHACKEGGSIILLAECRDGLGRPDFMKWFDGGNSGSLEQRLKTEYEVNGQTAWSLMSKTERYKIHLVSTLQDDEVKRMGMIPVASLESALTMVGGYDDAFILPRGASVLPKMVH